MESAFREGSAAPDLRLIETLYWDGLQAPRWPLHLERLRASVAALGWDMPELSAPVSGRDPARLRLTLDKLGKVEWQSYPLPPHKPLWTLRLATPRYCSADPWLRLKSTRRALQDAARAALPEDCDELIFLNERHEVCEGSITTLFFDRGDGLRTPPLSSGLLPGVLRRELSCPEQVLMAAELPHVKLWVGNALRGLIPAILMP